MNRNTSSSGAPKRSASRLDRMPAITRTAPSKMAMLTESREAIEPSCVGKTLLLHAYRRGPARPTDFCRPDAAPSVILRGCDPISGLGVCWVRAWFTAELDQLDVRGPCGS